MRLKGLAGRMNGNGDDIMVFMEGVLSVTLLRSWMEVSLFTPAALRHVYKNCLHFDSVTDIRVKSLSTYVMLNILRIWFTVLML